MNIETLSKRRNELLKTLPNNSIVVLFSGREKFKTADELYTFSPNRNFFYFTNIEQSDVAMILIKENDKTSEFLFIEKNDPIKSRWIGEKIKPEEAQKISGIKNIRFLDTFNDFLNQQIQKNENIYFDLERQSWNKGKSEAEEFALELKNKFPHVKINNIYNNISQLRMIKDEEEIKNIKKAISITKLGIENMIKNAKPNMMEYELEAYFDFSLISNGIREKAFHTITASGKNATVLHYSQNNCKAEDKTLVLLDLGAAYNHYSADISRTFPVNGKFTQRQKDVYNAVLKAQKEVEKNAKPGVTLIELNEIAKKVLSKECKSLGLIEKDDELIKYYFHGVSHHLGLDTHDVGDRSLPLQKGMVITNEPGLYIEEEGIGIRIEDDLLITENGCEVLSKEIIKEVSDIENFMEN
ncbi:Xaa-Pro aminopeptidase [Tepiditoga spiralis]|uniref:Xaa-Pro aminopeptidase n=1 Tax=Tepiditoga spiralis TaxID=2108365 RepID=A0A7G1G251_9BACT|nr:aminopeptidase P family protein [Tepiditoga spiralis]BBE30288.1 Xaa-Pro aminopeptidase [Tepiditoga spiralis]